LPRAHFIVHKECDETGCRQMESLLHRGYIQAQSLPMNLFAARFSGFDDYAGALKAHYRQDIVRSGIKLKNSGCTIARLKGGETLEGLYTEDVHRLYYAVVERAVNKLEILTRKFFLKLVQQFPDSVSFTYIRRENAIAAFNWAIRTERSYHLLFCGLDYALNAEADLYFNLMYAELNHAFRSNAVRIKVGQTADKFKARLGCTQAPLWFYIKARTAPFVFRLFARLLFPSRDRIRPYDIYKSARR
jgi:predicted N-acyltransferase